MIEERCTCPTVGGFKIHWDTCPFQFKRSEAFDQWWMDHYGSIGYYVLTNGNSDDAIDEYNLRMLFAWHGWKACAKALEKGLDT